MDNITVIKSRKGLEFLDIRELYRYRDLLFTFAERDFKVRYKQTVLGILWAVLQPFVMMIVFSFFFGKIAKMPSEGIPYPLFSYSGLILWTYFSNAITDASLSMISSANLISKVYFPRILLPTAATLVGLIDYGIAVVIVIGMLIFYKFGLNIKFLLLPFIVLLTWFLATGMGFWFSAVSVKYRDVRYALSFFIQLLVFATPVIYPASVAGAYKWVIYLNPLTGLIEAHRSLILNKPINFELLGLSIVFSSIIFFSGAIYFKSVEKYFADIV